MGKAYSTHSHKSVLDLFFLTKSRVLKLLEQQKQGLVIVIRSALMQYFFLLLSDII